MNTDANTHKQAEIASKERFLAEDRDHEFRKPFGPEWDSHDWLKWAMTAEIIHRLQIPAGARILDVGCGAGWTTLFLAESGFEPIGIEISPVFVEKARQWASRWNSRASFQTGDMDELSFHEEFDAVLVLNALHHTTRQSVVVENIARSLRPGGWVIFGEPSWLHNISPDARRVRREEGWVERGVTVRSLARDCRTAGLTEVRRFFEPTQPYERRVRGFGWQLIRLTSANLVFAPQALIWLAARKP